MSSRLSPDTWITFFLFQCFPWEVRRFASKNWSFWSNFIATAHTTSHALQKLAEVFFPGNPRKISGKSRLIEFFGQIFGNMPSDRRGVPGFLPNLGVEIDKIQHQMVSYLAGWWNFKIFYMFTPKLGEDDPIWLAHIFQFCWNHQPVGQWLNDLNFLGIT